MKYFTTEIVTVSGQTAVATYERANEATALSAHYSVMASALANPNCDEVMSMVLDNNGGIIKLEHWKKQKITE